MKTNLAEINSVLVTVKEKISDFEDIELKTIENERERKKIRYQ